MTTIDKLPTVEGVSSFPGGVENGQNDVQQPHPLQGTAPIMTTNPSEAPPPPSTTVIAQTAIIPTTLPHVVSPNNESIDAGNTTSGIHTARTYIRSNRIKRSFPREREEQQNNPLQIQIPLCDHPNEDNNNLATPSNPNNNIEASDDEPISENRMKRRKISDDGSPSSGTHQDSLNAANVRAEHQLQQERHAPGQQQQQQQVITATNDDPTVLLQLQRQHQERMKIVSATSESSSSSSPTNQPNIQALQTSNEQLSVQNDALRKQLLEFQNRENVRSKELENLNTLLQSTQMDQERERQAFQAQLESEKKSYQTSLQDMKSELEQQQVTSLQNAQSSNQSLRESLDILQSKYETATKDYERVRQSQTQLQQKEVEQQRQIDTLQYTMETSKKEAWELMESQQQNHSQQMAAALERQRVEYTTEIDQKWNTQVMELRRGYESQLAVLQEEKQQLRQQNQSLAKDSQESGVVLSDKDRLLDELRSQLSEYSGKHTELSNHVNTLQSQVKEQKQQTKAVLLEKDRLLDNLQNQVSNHVQKNTQLSDKVDTMTAQSSRYQQEIVSLKEALSLEAEASKAAREQTSSLRHKVAQSTQQNTCSIKVLQDELEQRKAAFSNSIANLKKELTKEQARANAAEQSVAIMQESIEKLKESHKDDADTRATQILELGQRIMTYEAKIQTLKNEKEGLSQQHVELRSEFKSKLLQQDKLTDFLKQRISSLEEERKTILSKYDDLAARNARLDAHVSKIEEEKDDLTSQVASLGEKAAKDAEAHRRYIEECKVATTSLKRVIKESSEAAKLALMESRAELVAEQASTSDAKRAVATLRRTMKDAKNSHQTEVSKMVKEQKRLEAQVKELQGVNTKAASEVEAHRQSVKEREATIVSLKAAMEEIQAAAEESEKDLRAQLLNAESEKAALYYVKQNDVTTFAQNEFQHDSAQTSLSSSCIDIRQGQEIMLEDNWSKASDKLEVLATSLGNEVKQVVGESEQFSSEMKTELDLMQQRAADAERAAFMLAQTVADLKLETNSVEKNCDESKKSAISLTENCAKAVEDAEALLQSAKERDIFVDGTATEVKKAESETSAGELSRAEHSVAADDDSDRTNASGVVLDNKSTVKALKSTDDASSTGSASTIPRSDLTETARELKNSTTTTTTSETAGCWPIFCPLLRAAPDPMFLPVSEMEGSSWGHSNHATPPM